MSESDATGRAVHQSPQHADTVGDRDVTIEILRGETAGGGECWDATTPAVSASAAGTSMTAFEALRRLAIVRSRQRRVWDGDAWVEYVPQSGVSVRNTTPQFTVEVAAFDEPDEHGRQWSAVTDGRDVTTGACGRTVGETLRLLARNIERKSRGRRGPDSSPRPSLPEHQVETLLESSRYTRFREAVTTRVAACFDRDGHMTGLPKLFVDGEAVGARQDTQWPDGIVLSVDRPGIVYDDLRRQFEAHLEQKATD